MSRRTLLIVSLIVSVALHTLLVAVSPRMSIFRPPDVPASVLQVMRVQLAEDTPLLPDVPEEQLNLGAQAEGIDDALGREAGREPADPAGLEPAETPHLEDRLARDNLQRQHELAVDETALARADARILEILSQTAREDVAVERQRVAPSPARLMAEGETPLLRGPSPSDEVLLIDPLSPGVGAPGGDAEAAPAPAYEDIAPEGGGEEGAPEGDRDITEPVKDLPRMPATLVREEIERDLRTERPYESMDALVDFELTTYRDPQGEAFFRLRIYPKQGEDIEVLPKDVTLVIDASRSIMQRKLELTAQGAERILASLRPEDRFNVLLFRDAPQPFRPEPVRATPDNLAQARRFLEGLKSRGETDVYQAMQPVIDTPPREGYPGIVLVVTDGRPTTGVRDGRTIINGLSQRNQLGQTIFTYGGGNTVNRTLLDLLAYRNRGASYFSPDLGDIDNDLPSFFGTLSDPILVDCQADFGRVPEQETFPSDLPDFYRDRVVTLYGRYDPAQHQEFVMRLTGQAGVEDKEIIFRADLEQAQTGDPDIARMWAFRKIYHLIGEIVRAGEQPELIEELRRLSREYRIATSYDEAL